MGAFGALAPFGLLSFGGAPTDAERIYASLQASVTGAFDTTEGSHAEASNFARALALAAARATMRHGANQRLPRCVVEALSDLEGLYGVVPTYGESNADRRSAIEVKRIISRGSRPEAIETALLALLGDDFWSVRKVAAAEITASADPDLKGAWRDPAQPHFFWAIATNIVVVNTPITVAISAISQDDAELPHVGDILCVQPENFGLAEAIEVEVVDIDASTIRATFTKAHDAGAALLTHAPMYASNQRTLLAAVTTAVAEDPPTHRRILDLLYRVVRGVTHPYVVSSDDGITAGPFTLALSPLGTAPLGTVTL